MACRRLLGGLTFSLFLNIATAAEPPATAVIGTPPQPAWVQLSAQQKIILAPLAKEWDSLENIRKKKWLAIAERYPAMKQDDQQRMQDRMREWAGLSPLERSKVRDTYKDFKQLPAEQKTSGQAKMAGLFEPAARRTPAPPRVRQVIEAVVIPRHSSGRTER